MKADGFKVAQQSQTGLHPSADVVPHRLVQQIVSLLVRLGRILPVVRLGNGLGQIHFLKGQEQTIAEGLQIQPLSPPRIHYRTDNIWQTITENRLNKKIGTVKSSDFTNEYTQTGSVSLILLPARNPYFHKTEKTAPSGCFSFGTGYKTSLESHSAIPFVSPPVLPIRQRFPIPAPIS